MYINEEVFDTLASGVSYLNTRHGVPTSVSWIVASLGLLADCVVDLTEAVYEVHGHELKDEADDTP